MAALSLSRGSQPRWSLDELSFELLVLILERLSNIDANSLAASRRLSRKFKAIATPIRYKTIRLTPGLLDPRKQQDCSEGLASICRHTRHVEIGTDLDPQLIRALLTKIERLSSVRWRYLESALCKSDFWIPSDILSPRHLQVNPIKLHIENLPLRDFRTERYNPYLRAIPPACLASLHVAIPTPPLTARLETLKGLLLKSRQLKVFSLGDRGQGTQFTFNDDEQLPAFTKLSLRSYDWNHSGDEVAKHWNFKEIRHLELTDVPLYPFLCSISFEDFESLKSLQLDDFSTHVQNRRRETTQGQYHFIKRIQALTDMKITCQTSHFPIDGLIHHASSLQDLRFRDYTGFSDEYRRCPTMKLHDLEHLARHLVQLHTLEIDMDERHCDPYKFLSTLCAFPKLRNLTLHTQTILDVFEDIGPKTDPDYNHVLSMFRLLHQQKQPSSWKSITINVGGWKRVMIRRLSAAWREQNARGVFAERCFVLERTEDGRLRVDERRPAEVS
ncbi:F-box domain-containing protein [Xylariaceae sp. FL1019]|nr:F-box domain-containing protein [Xylariaceae sp. FL1019]